VRLLRRDTPFALTNGRSSEYVTLKIHRQLSEASELRELKVLEAIGSVNSEHPGRKFLRTGLDYFSVTAPTGAHHHCLVHQPLWRSVWELQLRNPRQRYPEPLLRGLLKCILAALDFLHNDCKLIHTGIVSFYWHCNTSQLT
jgi:serine/threonine-protein kinase SRPK3